MPTTIHHYHLEQIIARIEGRPMPRIDTCGMWDPDREDYCGRPVVEHLVMLIDWWEDTTGVCQEHFDKHLREQLLA